MAKPMRYLTRLTLSRVRHLQGLTICINCCSLPACIVALPCGKCAMYVPSSVIESISQVFACACLPKTQPFEVSLPFMRLPTQGMGMGEIRMAADVGKPSIVPSLQVGSYTLTVF